MGPKKTTRTKASVGIQENAGRGPAERTALENVGSRISRQKLLEMEGLVGKGPGAEDVTRGTNAQRSLADLLKSYSEGGFMPGEADVATARQFTSDMFAPQQTQLNQQFQDQETQAARQAASMGRDQNDPVLRNMLAQSQGRQAQDLSSQQTQFASQFAQGLPGRRLQYAAGYADVTGQLATQAFSNRQALLSIGSQLQNQERNFRLAIADKTQIETSKENPGALAIGGAIAGGVGMAMGIPGAGAALGGMFGGGQGGGAEPSPQGPQANLSSNFTMPQMGSQIQTNPFTSPSNNYSVGNRQSRITGGGFGNSGGGFLGK